MGTLTVGRVGVEATLAAPTRWQTSATVGEFGHTITGHIGQATLADALYIRTELEQQVGLLVPITYTGESSLDGFYEINMVQIRASRGSLIADGYLPFSLGTRRVGGTGQVEHQSLLTGALIANNHGLVVGEVQFWHSPPFGALAYDGGSSGSPTAWTRTTEDGAIPVILDLDTTVDPKWAIDPGNYYDGGCYISVNSYTRSGLDAPNTPGTWEIGNKLVKVTPGGGGSSDGRIIVSHWDGSAYDAVTYNIKYATTDRIPEWHYVSIIRNTAEVVTIRLVRDADESPATVHRHVLDLTLRRGSLSVSAYFTWSGPATTWSLDRDSSESSTAITPTGASSAVALRATSNDGDGNRYVMGSSKSTTKDTTNGGLDFASTKTFDFFLGSEIGGSGASSNDQAADQCLQYLGAFAEVVRAVRR
jgi:hypothetical protein